VLITLSVQLCVGLQREVTASRAVQRYYNIFVLP